MTRIANHWWWPPLAGVLFALAFPPLNLLPLALVGLWPFFAYLDEAGDDPLTRVFAGGYLFGLGFFGAILYWIAGLSGFSAMAVPAYVASTMIMAFNGGLTAVGVGFAKRRGVPVELSFPLAWTASEWLRSFGDLGFTWAVAGDAVAAYPVLIQSAELGGAYLVSLWLTALSAFMYRLLRPTSPSRFAVTATVAVGLAVIVPAYGSWRIRTLEAASASWRTLRAAAIQPNVPQDEKWDRDFERETHRRLIDLTLYADQFDPDLVVWPESAVPSYLRYDASTRTLVPSLAAMIEAPILTGTNDADTLSGRSGRSRDDYRVYNAAYLVLPDSIVSTRHGKKRLVPVAERVPFVPGVATDFFEMLSSWTGQFTPGEGWPTWSVEGARFGTTICYESVFPEITRNLVRNGSDFMLNITNDAWFGDTAAPYQHASHLALRTVENRVPFLRAANTGVSGWVDPLGRYREATDLYTFGVVVADLPLPGITTPYTRWGDWLPIAALIIWMGLCIGYGRR